jgi:hypothetical protein
VSGEDPNILTCEALSTVKVTDVLKDHSTFIFREKHYAIPGLPDLEEGDTTITRNIEAVYQTT